MLLYCLSWEAGQPVHAGYQECLQPTVLQVTSTDNQKLAPSLSDRYRPRTFCLPDSAPKHRVDGLVLVTTIPPGLYGSEWRPARRRINLPAAINRFNYK